MAPRRVVVDLELGVARDDLAGLRHHEGVDLSGQRVVVRDGAVELRDDAGQGPRQVAQPRVVGELRELEVQGSAPRVRIEAGDRIRRLFGHLLDVHPALGGEHQDVGARVAVDCEAEVDLALDLQRGLAVDERHLEALDVHADDLLGGGARLVGGAGELDAPGLAATAHRHLRLDRDGAQPGERRGGGVGVARDHARRDRDAERGQDLFGLVLEELHP